MSPGPDQPNGPADENGVTPRGHTPPSGREALKGGLGCLVLVPILLLVGLLFLAWGTALLRDYPWLVVVLVALILFGGWGATKKR